MSFREIAYKVAVGIVAGLVAQELALRDGVSPLGAFLISAIVCGGCVFTNSFPEDMK